MSYATRHARALLSQLRIVYVDLQATAASTDAPLDTATLQHFGRRYTTEVYLCAQALKEEATAAAGTPAADEAANEVSLTLYAACAWELAITVFVGRPAVLTDVLVPWWQLHLCDRTAAERELPALCELERPETSAQFWSLLRKLIAQGMPEHGARLLRHHSAMRGGGEYGLQPLLERLQTMLEFMPRISDAGIGTHQQSEADPLFEKAALTDFQLRHRVWSNDLAELAREASLTSGAEAAEVMATSRLLCGERAELDRVASTWHEKLIARLLYSQPTLLRWQARAPHPRTLPPLPLPFPALPLPSPPAHPPHRPPGGRCATSSPSASTPPAPARTRSIRSSPSSPPSSVTTHTVP